MWAFQASAASLRLLYIHIPIVSPSWVAIGHLTCVGTSTTSCFNCIPIRSTDYSRISHRVHCPRRRIQRSILCHNKKGKDLACSRNLTWNSVCPTPVLPQPYLRTCAFPCRIHRRNSSIGLIPTQILGFRTKSVFHRRYIFEYILEALPSLAFQNVAMCIGLTKQDRCIVNPLDTDAFTRFVVHILVIVLTTLHGQDRQVLNRKARIDQRNSQI